MSNRIVGTIYFSSDSYLGKSNFETGNNYNKIANNDFKIIRGTFSTSLYYQTEIPYPSNWPVKSSSIILGSLQRNASTVYTEKNAAGGLFVGFFSTYILIMYSSTILLPLGSSFTMLLINGQKYDI